MRPILKKNSMPPLMGSPQPVGIVMPHMPKAAAAPGVLIGKNSPALSKPQTL